MSPSEVSLDRVLALLPEPTFRHRDIYTVAVHVGLAKSDGQTLWTMLRRANRIKPTPLVIAHGHYWERA